MSINSIMSVARTALNAHQTVIQTAGHNVANAETAGYTRQRVQLSALDPQQWTYGAVGTGVTVVDVQRVREELLDVAYRSETSKSAGHALRHELLGSVEGILAEPSETGLAATMDAFWASWSDLANNPTSAAARSVVQQRGQAVAVMLNGFDSQLTVLRDQAALQLSNAVTEVNGLSAEVAALNGRIVEAEVGGKAANDLRDARDLAIDRLAKHGEIRTVPNRDGSVQVMLGSNLLVDRVDARAVRVIDDGPTLGLRFEGSAEPITPVGGALTETVRFLNEDLAETRSRLDTLARSLVAGVNDAHTGGLVYDAAGTGTPAPPFFHRGDRDLNFPPPTLLPVTAGSIRLSDEVRQSARNIAASAATPSGGQAAGAGNNEIALQLAGFRTKAGLVTYTPAGGGAPETASFADFYRETASLLGTKVKDAESSAAVHGTLAEAAERRRLSANGVNVDEELTTLMRAQQAYAAAARVISAAEEMMRTLVEMV